MSEKQGIFIWLFKGKIIPPSKRKKGITYLLRKYAEKEFVFLHFS